MNYLTISNDFSQKYPDYKNDVMNFNEYLVNQWKNSLTDENIRFWLQGLDVNFILESLVYNVEEKKIYKSKASAKKYATVIGQFFNYIRKTTDIENPKLYEAISYNRLRENTYMSRMMAYIDGCQKLTGSVELEAVSESDVRKILAWADEQLENENLWYDVTCFRKAMSALGIKIMLIYGVTYRELRKIKRNQYDEIRNYITINGFSLRLPTNLAIQMHKMIQFLDTQKIFSVEGFFFTDAKGAQWGEITSSSGIPDYLGPLVGNTSITSIVKYGIIQLLKACVSDSVIKRLTGASDKLIQGCITYEDDDLVRSINNKLVTVDLYYEF